MDTDGRGFFLTTHHLQITIITFQKLLIFILWIPSPIITFRNVCFQRGKKKKRVRPVYIIFYQSFQRKGKRKMSLSHSHRFSPFRLNLMWKASCMPLLITNNPEYSSMPFLQLYFLYCSNKINGGDPNNFSQVRNSVHLMQLKFA